MSSSTKKKGPKVDGDGSMEVQISKCLHEILFVQQHFSISRDIVQHKKTCCSFQY